MGRALFYQLSDEPAEAVLPALLERALGAGLRVVVRGTDRARLEALDLALWRRAGFLPHGLEGGPHDALQPVLLVATAIPAPALANRPSCLIAIDGAPVVVEEALALERVLVLFEGADPAQLANARGQWKALTAAGIEAEYWMREGGRWLCRARHSG